MIRYTSTGTLALLSVLLLFTFIPSSFADDHAYGIVQQDLLNYLVSIPEDEKREILQIMSANGVFDIDFKNSLIESTSDESLSKILAYALHDSPTDIMALITVSELIKLLDEIDEPVLVEVTAGVLFQFLAIAEDGEAALFLETTFNEQEIIVIGDALGLDPGEVPIDELAEYIVGYLELYSVEQLKLLLSSTDGSSTILANLFKAFPITAISLTTPEQLEEFLGYVTPQTLETLLKQITLYDVDSILFDGMIQYATGGEITSFLLFALQNYPQLSEIEKRDTLQVIADNNLDTNEFMFALIDTTPDEVLSKILAYSLYEHPVELVGQITLDELDIFLSEIPNDTLIPATASMLYAIIQHEDTTLDDIELFLTTIFSPEELDELLLVLLGYTSDEPEVSLAFYLKTTNVANLESFLNYSEFKDNGSTSFILANLIKVFPEETIRFDTKDNLALFLSEISPDTIQFVLNKSIELAQNKILFDGMIQYATDDELTLMLLFTLTQYPQETICGCVTDDGGNGSGDGDNGPDSPPPAMEIIPSPNYITPTAVSAITDGSNDVLGETFTELYGARYIDTVLIEGRTYALVTSQVPEAADGPSNDGAIQIIDITNPSSPLVVSTLIDGDGSSGTATSLGGARQITTTVTEFGDIYALVASKDDNSIQVININDPYNPVDESALITAGGEYKALNGPVDITTVVIEGITYALVASFGSNGVQIIDVADPPDSIAVSAIIDGDKDSSGKTFTTLGGAQAITTVLIDGRTYALVTANDDNGVQIIDITNPYDPLAIYALLDDNDDNDDDYKLLGPYSTTTVVIEGITYALVASGTGDSLQIIDISDTTAFINVAVIIDDADDNSGETFTTLDGADDITTVVINNIIYALVTSHNNDGVQIIDITDPYDPLVVTALIDGDEYTTLKNAFSITTVEIGSTTYALVASYGDDGVQIIDLSSPALSDYTPKKKNGGGCSGDCTPPTFGNDENNRQLVKGGFSYNGQAIDVTEFWTPYDLVTAKTGEVVNFTIKAYENNGVNNIKWFQFGIVPEVGTPLNDAEILATFYITSSSIDEIVEEENYDLFDIVSATTYVEQCGYITSDCLELSIDVMFNEELINKVIVIDVIDNPRNSNTKYLNDGIDTVGESMNEPLISHVTVSNGGVFYPQKAGSVELVLTSYKNSEWQDEYGYMWKEDFDNNTFRITSDIPVPQREADLMWSAMTRMNSNFEIMKYYEAQRAVYSIFDGSKLISELPDSWAYELPPSEAQRALELDERIELEKNRVSNMMDGLFPYQLSR